MNNAAPALLALLLVLSLPAMTVVATNPVGSTGGSDPTFKQVLPAQTEPAEIDGTTNRLQLSGTVRSEHAEYSAGLGTAIASADDELRIDHEQYAIVDDEFDSATAEERAAMLQTAYERLMERVDALEQRERNAVEAHADGEQSTNELLQTLLRNYNEAEKLSASLDELEDRAIGVPDYSLPSNRSDRKTLDAHRTALRTSLSQRFDTTIDDGRHNVVVSTTASGYSLSMLDGDRYLVETTRFDNRDETAPNQFEDREAYDRILELYPWADEHGNPHFQDNSPDHYWTEIAHDHGRLELYLDSGTGDVYREMQELTVESLPQTELESESSDGLAMSINETPARGPIEVTVTEAETGEPETATVSIDGTEVGETDEDGTLWVVPPIVEYEIEANGTSGNVSATIAGSDRIH